MSETELVLCKWESRLWPAQILSGNSIPKGRRNPKKLCSVKVKIITHNEQVTVPLAHIEPLTVQSIESIAAKLAPTALDVKEELGYRRALREALDILSPRAASKETEPFKGGEPKPSAGKEMQDQPPVAQGWIPPPEEESTEEAASDPLGPPAAFPGRELRSGTRCPSNQQRPLSSREPAQAGRGLLKARKLNGASNRLKAQSQDDGKPDCFSTGSTEQPSGSAGSGQEPPLSLPARASALATVSHQDPPKLTPAEGKAGAAPGLPGALLGEAPTEPANPLSAAAEAPQMQKYQKASGGKRCSPRLAAITRLQQSVDGPEGEGSKGLESTPDLSLLLSPVRAVSLSPVSRDDEEEEELPSILLHQEPCSFEAGMMVWYKIPRYPYWPAVVKMVNRKAKKASVLLIEKCMDAKKSKGFYTSLRNLKHFDCEEKQTLIDKARENYHHDINWCINLIANYRIRVGCHSFMGSFLEYCADDMSYPVRKETLHDWSQMTFPQMEQVEDTQESISEVEVTPTKQAKKILPDRMRAARDRANEKIVEFIVKARGADKHLRSILKSKKQSRWLKKFLRTPRYLILETYLEDDCQQDLVLNYLQEVYREVGAQELPLKNGDSAKFVLEVLFPEAIIYAISAVDQIDYKSAEEKYINGPSVSQREREQFEKDIQEKGKHHLPSNRLS